MKNRCDQKMCQKKLLPQMKHIYCIYILGFFFDTFIIISRFFIHKNFCGFFSSYFLFFVCFFYYFFLCFVLVFFFFIINLLNDYFTYFFLLLYLFLSFFFFNLYILFKYYFFFVLNIILFSFQLCFSFVFIIAAF